MFNCNALLLKDFYKAIHCDLIPKNMTKSVSYFTPRMSRVTASRNPKKGCCRVYNENGEIKFVDNLNWLESMQGTLMQSVFKNGKMVKEESLNEIRQRLNNDKF